MGDNKLLDIKGSLVSKDGNNDITDFNHDRKKNNNNILNNGKNSKEMNNVCIDSDIVRYIYVV